VSRDGEQGRYLHRNPTRNYTSQPYLAARREPEAVDPRRRPVALPSVSAGPPSPEAAGAGRTPADA